MSEGGEDRACNELSSLAMDQSVDLLASLGDACDLDCHLDLADIGEDWVSLMMLDAGSDSIPVSGDISFSDISCTDVGPSDCPREQVHDGSGSDPGSQTLFPADMLWDGIASGGNSATSSLFMSKDGSDSDLVFDTSGNQLFAHLQSNFPHISLRNSPVTGSSFSHMSFSSPEDASSWPSPHSSFMETEGSNGFLIDADLALECLTDQMVSVPGSDLPNRYADAVHCADTRCAECVNIQICEANSGQGIPPSGSHPVVVSSQANSAASSSGSAGGRVDKGSPLCGAIDVLRPGEDHGESPMSSTNPISSGNNGDRRCTRSEGRVNQPDTREECRRDDNGEATRTGRYEVVVVCADERLGESCRDRPEGDNVNFTGIKCEKEVEKDLVPVEASDDSSPIVPSRWKYNSRGAPSAEEQEGTSKGTKRKGEDRSVSMPSGSACSDGQHSDVSDGDKKNAAGDAGEEDDEKRKARLMRNRESAQQSRQRKKIYVDELEQKLRTMAATIAELNATISHLTTENVNLRRQLGYLFQPNPALAGRPPLMAPPLVPLPPYAGMYGMRPMIPGVPAPPMPIPRLKPHSSVSKTTKKAAKAPAAGEDVGGDKKRRRKAAKAASVGIVGLFCFIMVIGPYSWSLPEFESSGRLEHRNVPRVGRVLNSWEDEHEPKGYWLPGMPSWFRYFTWSTRQYDTGPSVESLHERRSPYRGRDLSLSRHVNKESFKRVMKNATSMSGRTTSRQVNVRRRENEEIPEGNGRKQKAEVNSSAVFIGGMLFANASEPFPASLSVPRNNQLVTIEGSLIIQAIMAGDEAAAMRHSNLRNMEEAKESSRKVLQGAPKHPVEGQEEQGLALEGTSRQVLQEPSPRLSGEQGSGAPDKRLVSASAVKSQALSAKQEATYSSKLAPAIKAGKLFSQLIMDDVKGLGLRTGICTEVFQFDATPVVGHVARPHSARSDGIQNSTDGKDQSRYRRGRRDPFAIPLPPAQTQASEMRNKTHDRTISGGEGFKEKSSMVVSIFTALQDVKDEERTVTTGAKGGTKIFVVILVDGVKYVTYSCPLPPSKSQPQVVAG